MIIQSKIQMTNVNKQANQTNSFEAEGICEVCGESIILTSLWVHRRTPEDLHTAIHSSWREALKVDSEKWEALKKRLKGENNHAE